MSNYEFPVGRFIAGQAPEGASGKLPSGAQPGNSEGGCITNRPPYISTTVVSWGGLDWLEASLYLNHSNFSRLQRRLDHARAAAEAGAKGKDEIKIYGMKFLVLPAGAGAGGDGKTVYYRWQLKCENGLLIQLMNRDRPHETIPNGVIRATSLLLMRYGGEAVWQDALKIIRALGYQVVRNKVSRVDPCVDLPGTKFEEFGQAYDSGHYVSRARYASEFGENEDIVDSKWSLHKHAKKTSTISFGRGHVSVRIYDKWLECRHNVEKLEVMINHRWGEFTCLATRVEFRLRREKLKILGIDSVEDWFNVSSDVCRYLCTEWFRLTAEEPDPAHPERTPILPLWCKVCAAFAAWNREPKGIKFRPLATKPVLPKQLLEQTIGVLTTILAIKGITIDDNEAFLHEGFFMVAEAIERRNMATEVARRILERGNKPTLSEGGAA